MPHSVKTIRIVRRVRGAARLATLAALAIALVPLAPLTAQSGSARVQFQTRSEASLADATDYGPLASPERLKVTLTFSRTPAQSAALRQYLLALATPSSDSYRKWLTPAEFAAQYGATSAQVAAATAWAQAEGLTVESVAPSGTRMTISASPSQMEQAFAVSIHRYAEAGLVFYANAGLPSLEAGTAALFSSMEGLDDSPENSGLTAQGAPVTFPALGELVDNNVTPILALNSGLCSASVSASQIAEYTTLFKQAAAQGLTALATSTCATGGFPAALPEVTAVVLPGQAVGTTAPLTARPGWQVAPGLPMDGLRHSPDVTAPSLSALASTLQAIAATMPAKRLGNVNPVLYQLAPTPGLYDQGGTWEAATGLGLVDLAKLAKAFPRGTGASFASFSASSYSPTHGQSITLTSSVTSGTGGMTPSGTSSFVTSTGQTIGTSTLTAGTATYATNTLAGGSYTVAAQYSGDSDYAPAASAGAQISVQPEASQLSVNISTGNVVGGTYTVAVTDVSASGIGLPSGNITLSLSGTGTTYTQALSAISSTSAATTFTVPANTVGTLTLAVNCSGDQSFSCFNAKTATVTVAKAAPGISFTYTPDPVAAGDNESLTAMLTAVGTAPVPTGTVTFYDGVTVLNAGTLSNGTATAQGTVPNTATHSISAVYSGDSNYSTVTSTGGAASAPANAVVSLTTSNAAPAAGSSVTLTAAVAGPGGNASPTGTVTFTDSVSGSLGQAALVNGVATLATASLPTGTSTVIASYGGSANYNMASSAPVSEAIAGSSGTATLAATLSPGTAAPGAGATVTGTVTFAAGTPSGVVVASISYPPGSTTAYTGTLIEATATSASFTIPVTVPPVGTYTVLVSCPSTDSFSCNTVSLPLTSSGTALIATTTALTINPAAPASGAAVTLTANVTSATTGATPISGTVSFYNGTALLGSGKIAAGLATATATLTGTSTASLTAIYSGDPVYGTSTSAPIAVDLSLATSTVTLSASTSSGIVGANITLTAQVAGTATGGASPTGTVSFYVSSATPQLLGKAQLAPTGVGTAAATFNTSSIPSGSETVYAAYAGDENFAASQSGLVAIGVTDYSVVFTPVSLSLTAGQSGSVALQVNTSGGFSGTIALGCSPPANVEITCSLNQKTLSGPGSVELTITTAAPAVAANHVFELKAIGGMSVAAFACLLMPSGKKRRLPALFTILLAVGLTANMGCASGSSIVVKTGGTPLGTVNLTINTSGSNGMTAVSHDYSYQVTVQ